MLAANLLLQLAVIISAAHVFGFLFRRLGQPAVIGEMVAGIILGPSILGHLFPDQYPALFSSASRSALTFIAQTGIILFMFVVGTRVEFGAFRRQPRAIALIAASGIVVPFLLGCFLAVYLYAAFAAPWIPRLPFILFIAAAMSVTAFPVLARIIIERRLEGTVPGTTALICAALNDAVAWILVASIAALVAEQTPVSLSVYGIFVAFAAGVACAVLLPRATQWANVIEFPATKFLLPVFFALTGLRTDLKLLTIADASWLWCAAIILTATVGKLGATALTALWTGMRRPDALVLGALMNTRGLMELVVLNIGYELGLLPSVVFAMMVLMALVTTCAAGPLVSRWSVPYRSASAVAAP